MDGPAKRGSQRPHNSAAVAVPAAQKVLASVLSDTSNHASLQFPSRALHNPSNNIALHYSVVPRVEPEPEDLSDELRREEGRLKDRRDPREVSLLVLLEAAVVSDSYDSDVRVRVIDSYLSARAEE